MPTFEFQINDHVLVEACLRDCVGHRLKVICGLSEIQMYLGVPLKPRCVVVFVHLGKH